MSSDSDDEIPLGARQAAQAPAAKPAPLAPKQQAVKAEQPPPRPRARPIVDPDSDDDLLFAKKPAGEVQTPLPELGDHGRDRLTSRSQASPACHLMAVMLSPCSGSSPTAVRGGSIVPLSDTGGSPTGAAPT